MPPQSKFDWFFRCCPFACFQSGTLLVAVARFAEAACGVGASMPANTKRTLDCRRLDWRLLGFQ